MKKENELQKELQSFQKLWKGGTSLSARGWDVTRKANLSRLDVDEIVRICIEPYINPETNVLEIGCNGGGWTWKFLEANEVYGFDALSAEHTGFWNYIEKKDNIHYCQVKDFNCEELEDDSIDYVFSYDVFCHISYSGTSAYLKNLFKKLKKGANCFIMIADADKYTDERGRRKLMKRAGFSNFDDFVRDYDGKPTSGRWYFYGIERFCDLLEKYGYTLVSGDVAVDADKNNPIIHFRK